MGLWDRIYKDQKLEKEGAPPAAPEQKIDLTNRPAEIWGQPGRCPQCGGLGYLDRIDIIDRVQYEHCTECFHKWSVHEKETVRAN